MEREIDARGLACPQPVMKAREELARGAGPFAVLVDNATARDNVSRFARTSGCEIEVDERDGAFLVKIMPGAVADDSCEIGAMPSAGFVLLVAGDEVGRGERELGIALMKTFLYATAEGDVAPAKLIFMNSGVRLVTENEETAEHVRKLEERGTEVLVCGTCLDYYDLKESLLVGRISNMYEIQSSLVGATRVVCT